MKTQLPTTTKNKEGFTLIELLIAITIVAILSVIAYSIFSNIQKGSRDSVRRVEIDTLSKNIESSFNPSTRTYSYTDGTANAMYESDFVNNFPHDPLLNGTDPQAYCVSVGTTASQTAPTDPTSLTDWAAGSQCPTTGTWVPFNDKTMVPTANNLAAAMHGACTATGMTSLDCTTINNAYTWTICAKLEATTGFYCKSSLQ